MDTRNKHLGAYSGRSWHTSYFGRHGCKTTASFEILWSTRARSGVRVYILFSNTVEAGGVVCKVAEGSRVNWRIWWAGAAHVPRRSRIQSHPTLEGHQFVVDTPKRALVAGIESTTRFWIRLGAVTRVTCAVLHSESSLFRCVMPLFWLGSDHFGTVFTATTLPKRHYSAARYKASEVRSR